MSDYNPNMKPGMKPGEIVLSNVRIVFRNFAGEERQYNTAGKRNFAVVLSPELAVDLEQEGWNVKRRPPKEDGDEEFCFLPVTVSYKGRPPRVVLLTSRGRTTLDQDTAEMVDVADIDNVDMIMRPYDWEVNGNRGRKAYLQSIYVTLYEDELELRYADVNEIGYNEPDDVEEFEE
jgi:hypothetical protein